MGFFSTVVKLVVEGAINQVLDKAERLVRSRQTRSSDYSQAYSYLEKYYQRMNSRQISRFERLPIPSV